MNDKNQNPQKREEPHVSSGKWESPTKGKAQEVPSKHKKAKEPEAKPK